MESERLTARQKGALCFAAGLAPATALLPRAAATPWGFLAPATALAVCTLSLLLLRRRAPGRAAAGAAGLWCVVLLGRFAPAAARRISDAAYGGQGTLCFLLLLAAAAGGVALCRERTLGRLSEVLCFPAAACLLLLLPFAFSGGDWRAACAAPDWAALGRGTAMALPAMATLPVLAALTATAEEDPGPPHALWWGAAVLAAAMTGVLAAVLYTLGPAWAAALDDPFLMLLKGLRLFGAAERIEPLAAGVLVQSDVLLLGALAQLGGRLLSTAAGRGRAGLWSAGSILAGVGLALWAPVSDGLLCAGAGAICLMPLALRRK